MGTELVRGTPNEAISGTATDASPEIDLGNLTILQTSLAEDPGVAQGVADATKSMATRLTQELLNQLFSLPFTSSPEGRTVQLPDRLHPLPREKPLPQPKPLTPWEKFAKEKGIVKKKRSKLVFDEATQDWKRRHGYGKANDALDVPIIEASDKDKDGEDPFARLAREKSDRTKASKASASQLATESSGMPATVKLSTKLDPATVRGQIAKGKAMSKGLKEASYLAGVSTASMGKFDKRLRGEGENERKLPGSRKNVLPLTGDTAEHAAAEKVLGKVVRKSEGGLVNVQRAVGNLEAERARAKHSKRLSGDDSDNEDGSGKRKKGRVGRVKNRRVPKQSKQTKLGVQKGGTGKSKGKGSVGKKGSFKKR